MAVAHKFIVADDHPLFRAALTQALRQLAPQAEIVEADTMEATTEVVNRHPDADLILLDLHMPGAHGFSGLIQLRGQMPDIPVAVVSGSDEPYVVRRAIDYGASGFIPKSYKYFIAFLPSIFTGIKRLRYFHIFTKNLLYNFSESNRLPIDVSPCHVSMQTNIHLSFNLNI